MKTYSDTNTIADMRHDLAAGEDVDLGFMIVPNALYQAFKKPGHGDNPCRMEGHRTGVTNMGTVYCATCCSE